MSILKRILFREFIDIDLVVRQEAQNVVSCILARNEASKILFPDVLMYLGILVH